MNQMNQVNQMKKYSTAYRWICCLGIALNLTALEIKPPPWLEPEETRVTYRFFQVKEENDKVIGTEPVKEETTPPWARSVSQELHSWVAIDPDIAYFKLPIPFVVPPSEGSSEPFHSHNHQPDITWLPNGDLMAIWYSTMGEQGTELTVLASRLRAGSQAWEPASEFFKATNRNMHGNSLFYDKSTGLLHHLNGMGRLGVPGWDNLALLHRFSTDNGVTWSVARPISSGANFQKRHQVIAGIVRTSDGALIQPCDATPRGEGPTAIHISRDGGRTWTDPGGDIRGIHAGIESLPDGRLLALGRSQAIDGHMPISLTSNMGKTWNYSPSPFPPIGSGQRLVLLRLIEGPLLLVSFTNYGARDFDKGMSFIDADAKAFEGLGLYTALSRDDGVSWSNIKLLTPGKGTYDGGAWTQQFTASPTRAEHAGYLAATQAPDGIVHLISSRLHYRFNLKWLETPAPSIP